MISLNYSLLLKKYNEILTSTSRGFDTEHEFLELWVPNDDINQSISELIIAANDYDTKKIKIVLSGEEFKKANLENLKKRISDLGNINIEDQNIIFVGNKNK